MKVSILGYGSYLPRYRVKREDIARAWGASARGENAIPNVNEDVVTMAIEAAQNALGHAGADPAQIGAIYLGTGSAPYIEQSSVGTIAATLGVPASADAMDFGASPRAALAALKACLDAVVAGRVKMGLVIGSDCRQPAPGSDQELAFGAGAAAFLLGSGPGLALVEEVFTYATPFRDSWRAAEEQFVRTFEPRYSREYGYSQHIQGAVKGLLARTGGSAADFQQVVLYQPDDRIPRTVARSLGIKPQQLEAGTLFPLTGDTGASMPLLSLAAVLDRAQGGERVLVCSYGSGASDALSLTVGDVASRRPHLKPLASYLGSKEYLDYAGYLRHRGILKDTSPPAKMGLPPMSPLVSRELVELLRLVGARCTGCGYVNFPPSERRICIRCGNTSFQPVLLPRRGKIHTYCVSYYLPAGFDECPLPVIIADLDDGTRHRALGTEMKPEEIKIDREVELVVRRLATEDNVNLYGNVFRFPRM